ncbi:hypothetical protein ABK040_002886 [Willaertia magna]
MREEKKVKRENFSNKPSKKKKLGNNNEASSSDDVIDRSLALDCGSKKEHDKNCKLCGESGHKFEKCPNYFCPTCVRRHPSSKICPYEKTPPCDHCGKKGHAEKNCPLKQFLLTKDDITSDVICFSCGESGHLNCCNPFKSFSKNNKYCFNCGEEGHSGLECEHTTLDEILDACVREERLSFMDTYIARKLIDKSK